MSGVEGLGLNVRYQAFQWSIHKIGFYGSAFGFGEVSHGMRFGILVNCMDLVFKDEFLFSVKLSKIIDQEYHVNTTHRDSLLLKVRIMGYSISSLNLRNLSK